VLSTRNATLADIPLIRDLTFRVWPQTYGSILTPEQIDYMLEMMYSEVSLEQQMKEGCQFILVLDKEEPVGFASVQETSPSEYKLHKFYILGQQQRKGTGRFMLDQILHTIQQQGASSLQLQVNRNNTAKNFYEKLGFTVIREIKLDIGNGYFMDDYIMEKKITDP
jgi:ribosomal protein S18 acetylase RimI-like enzyme